MRDTFEWHNGLSSLVRQEMNNDLNILGNEFLREFRLNRFQAIKNYFYSAKRCLYTENEFDFRCWSYGPSGCQTLFVACTYVIEAPAFLWVRSAWIHSSILGFWLSNSFTKPPVDRVQRGRGFQGLSVIFNRILDFFADSINLTWIELTLKSSGWFAKLFLWIALESIGNLRVFLGHLLNCQLLFGLARSCFIKLDPKPSDPVSQLSDLRISGSSPFRLIQKTFLIDRSQKRSTISKALLRHRSNCRLFLGFVYSGLIEFISASQLAKSFLSKKNLHPKGIFWSPIGFSWMRWPRLIKLIPHSSSFKLFGQFGKLFSSIALEKVLNFEGFLRSSTAILWMRST